MKWSDKENQILEKQYSSVSINKLRKQLNNRSWSSIQAHARRLNLKRDKRNQKQSNLGRLLQNEPTAYYWIGFLLADGHFASKFIDLSLAIKDRKHLLKFNYFIDGKCQIRSLKRGTMCGLKYMDSEIVPLLTQKFQIHHRKTYNPPNITVDNKDLMFALIIGFIDGDGCISFNSHGHNCSLVVKCHKSWRKNLEIMSEFLNKLGKYKPLKVRLTKDNCALFSIRNNELLRIIKKKAISLNLPILLRKWNRITDIATPSNGASL